MSTFLKQMFVKDSDFNRRGSEFLRTTCFGTRFLLTGSSVVLVLALLGWCGLLSPAFRWFTPYAFVVVMFLAPAFTVIALMDIRRSGWTLSRCVALVCSAVAVALLVIAVYQVIHRVYAT
jgi:hypothetical protein